jgi:hypothetical protein
MVAQKTLAMFEGNSPFLGICPWLLADQDMGGSGWPSESWHGYAWQEIYGRRKPVIELLAATSPPGNGDARAEVRLLREEIALAGEAMAGAGDRVGEADASLAAAEEALS